MATYSHPIVLPATSGVTRPARRADAIACPWAPPDPATRIDIGWQPDLSARSPWPPPVASARVAVQLPPPTPPGPVAASTPLPPPPPANLIAPVPAAVGEAHPARSRLWLVGLAAGAAGVAATVAALIVSL